MLSEGVRKKVELLFLNDFLLSLKTHCEDYFHFQKADRSKCARRRDFSSSYIKYCQEHFGRKYGPPEIFCNLKEQIKSFMDFHKKVKIGYQVYGEDGGAALILVIVTSLMIREHQKAYVLV